MPGESDSEPDVYATDAADELGDVPSCDRFLEILGIVIGSVGIGSFGWLVEDSVMQTCRLLHCGCILKVAMAVWWRGRGTEARLTIGTLPRENAKWIYKESSMLT